MYGVAEKTRESFRFGHFIDTVDYWRGTELQKHVWEEIRALNKALRTRYDREADLESLTAELIIAHKCEKEKNK